MKMLSVFGVTSVDRYRRLCADRRDFGGGNAPAPLPQPDGITAKVRMGCGPGRLSLIVPAWPEVPFASTPLHAIERRCLRPLVPTISLSWHE